MGDLNYLVEPNDWQKYISENELFKEGQTKKLKQLLL